MSISGEIERIEQNVTNTYAVLDALGADLPAEQNSDNLATTAGTVKAVLYSAQSLTNAQKTQARTNIGALAGSDLSLAFHSDGLLYIFANGSPVGEGINIEAGGDVIGYVDENNNIVLTGNLADGTYSIKYEIEGGETVDIGDLVLDSNVYYSVTKTLTNCTINNSATEVIEGESYSATITANDGYELSSVSVTMGGAAVTVSGGVISIASVTGNIVINAVAEEIVVEIVNRIPLSTDSSGNPFNNGQGWKTGYRLSSSSGKESASSGNEVTGFMPIKYGDTIAVKYVSGPASGVSSICLYDANYTFLQGRYFTPFITGVDGSALNGEVASKALTTTTWSAFSSSDLSGMEDSIAYFRFSASEITADSIVTINQPLE